jgi:hypothetical protein
VIGCGLCKRTKLHRGDRIDLETKEGKSSLPIVGVTNGVPARADLTVYLGSRPKAKELLDIEGTDAVIVKAKPGAPGESHKWTQIETTRGVRRPDVPIARGYGAVDRRSDQVTSSEDRGWSSPWAP